MKIITNLLINSIAFLRQYFNPQLLLFLGICLRFIIFYISNVSLNKTIYTQKLQEFLNISTKRINVDNTDPIITAIKAQIQSFEVFNVTTCESAFNQFITSNSEYI